MPPDDMSFRGRLFGPGIAGGGIPVSGRWRGDVLHLQGADLEYDIPAATLGMRAAGFNLQQTGIHWNAGTGEFAFFLDQPADQAAFVSGAPVSLATLLAKSNGMRNGMRRRFGLGAAAVLLYLLLPVIAIFVFFLNTDAIAQWAADRVPVKYEEKIGTVVLNQIKSEQKLIDRGPAVDAVRQIGSRLHPGSRYTYRWFVAENNDVNAFALPGGVVVVHAGLIREAGSAGELAGVLAHEVAHVEQRHALKNLVKNAGFGILLSVAFGDLSGSTIAAWSGYLTQMKFSRDAEMDADRDGVKRMVAAGIDPHAMLSFFSKMAEKEGKGASAMSVLATHPSSQERMLALQELIRSLPPANYAPLPVDWASVKSAVSAKSAM
ncbi:MAG TPA: M48 family metallopeptidase [Noviherbaspirillum sp.]|jgi:Zn-dependent protease with chaperone function|uniref:M48 family metallopeptidase n=1 Tax=Noviherbaspirillum sp. TaxID=1926288 RepID=UPI002DDD7587|nr:M48 family metallopeptidase [Noviherbaspirillum sp.]HEV2609273.1 M48 family metallopeptidase [Noviherbaspirillum sp.]